MFEILKKKLGRVYQPLNTIEVNSLFLRHNYTYLSSINPHIKVAPVLKSNAYGHGIVPVAKILDTVGAPFLCVDSLYEAYELLNAGIKTKVLIMGYIDPENLKVKKLPFSYAVYDEKLLEVINSYQKGAGIHIKFDSGMHRLGVQLEDLPEFLTSIKRCSHIKVEGFMSHFAESEHPESDLTKYQIANYMKAVQMVSDAGLSTVWNHIGNSEGMLHSDILNLAEFTTMVRTGLALYGIDSREKKSKDRSELKPVLRLTSKIVQIKQIKKGERIGYNGTYKVKNDMTIGIVPLGYYDGVDRRLSNKGMMYIDNCACPIIGRVSMNITTIDISSVSSPVIGQRVVVYSDNTQDANSIKGAAEICETIPYDILVHLASSTRRVIT